LDNSGNPDRTATHLELHMPNTFDSPISGAPPDARHPKVIELFRKWSRDHEEVRVFVGKVELQAYQANLNQFIKDADAVKASVKGQTLSGVRFKQSITAIDTLIRHAQGKHAFFYGHFVELKGKSKTFARVMTFDEQNMVPQTKDFEGVTEKIKQLQMQDDALRELTPSQAWALVAANLNGKQNELANTERAALRLTKLNGQWGTNYTTDDLKTTYDYMTGKMTTKPKPRIATQYRMEKPVGEQQVGTVAAGTVPLYKLLMASGFRNMWETGVSQASANRAVRGAVEERMGYGAALRRTGGKPGYPFDESGTFEPKNRAGEKTEAEMPLYGGTITDAQQVGVTKQRYGTSYIVWKESIRNRVTWTPGDSWSGSGGPMGVKNYVSLEHPEVIFAHAESHLLRLFMAEATGIDKEWLAEQKRKGGGAGDVYIETQIHGDLSWSDVAEVVLDAKLPKVDTMREEFEAFKRKKNLTFTVGTHSA
jgi:hypothetical protein